MSNLYYNTKESCTIKKKRKKMFITKKRKQSDPCIHPNSMQVKTPTSDGLNHPCQYSNLMEHSILLYTTNPLTKPKPNPKYDAISDQPYILE